MTNGSDICNLNIFNLSCVNVLGTLAEKQNLHHLQEKCTLEKEE